MQYYDGHPETLFKKFIKKQINPLYAEAKREGAMEQLLEEAQHFTETNFTGQGLYAYVKWLPKISKEEQKQIMDAIEKLLPALCDEFVDAYHNMLMDGWEPDEEQLQELEEYEPDSEEYWEAMSEMEMNDINWHWEMNPPKHLFKLVLTFRFAMWLTTQEKLHAWY
jgi:hypothetical protein